MDVVVSHLQMEADRVVSIQMRRTDDEEFPAWTPGAHIDVVIPLERAAGRPSSVVERQYSLCGDPGDRKSWQIAVLHEAEGRGGSEYLCAELKEGQNLTVHGPRNNFELVRASTYLFIAGGIGITPLLPMIAVVDRLGLPWRLLYGGRRRATMAFTGFLSQFPEKVVVWPEDECGLLDIARFIGEPSAGAAIYCCGPEPLLAAVEAQTSVSWDRGQVHIERFKPRPDAQQGPLSEFEVHLALAGLTVQVGPGDSIVDAIERAGIDVPSSCREGVCGTCETLVLDGVPDHRDSFLTDDEREDNSRMMICCSRSHTPRLTLEL
jgi:ferredoxin-NADP reductase